MNNIFDYVLIIILVLAVAGILTMGIITVINKRLGEVAINIPKISIPKPEVTVNIAGIDDICRSRTRNSTLPYKAQYILEKFSPLETTTVTKNKESRVKIETNNNNCGKEDTVKVKDDKIESKTKTEVKEKKEELVDGKKNKVVSIKTKTTTVKDESIDSSKSGEDSTYDINYKKKKKRGKLRKAKGDKIPRELKNEDRMLGQVFGCSQQKLYNLIPDPENDKWLPSNYTNYSYCFV